MKIQKKDPDSLRGFIWLVFLTVILAACQHIGNYRGYIVRPENRVTLREGGSHSGVLDTNDLLFAYRLMRQGNHLQLSGSVEFVGGVQNFPVVEHFYLRAYCLNGQGRVLGKKGIFSVGYGRRTDSWSFRRNLELPDGTAALAFGYSGQVRDTGIDPTEWNFWKTPF